MERCSKCVMTANTPGISFDNDGVCNYCKTYKPFRPYGEERLLKLLNSYRGHGKYDCMVTVSGGRDSSYTLLKLVKDYGMKVLALNYQNPYTHNQATKNIQNMVRILNVDLIKISHPAEIHKRLLKYHLKVWLRHQDPAAIPFMCIGCKLPHIDFIKVAKKYDIHCIIEGGNPLESTSFKVLALGLKRDSTNKLFTLSNMPHLIGFGCKNIPYFINKYFPIILKSILFENQYAIGPKLLGPDIEHIDLFHYIPWNEQDVISRIKHELDWESADDKNGTWRFDCKIADLKDYLYFKTLGMTEKDDFYSKMILENLITRDQALERLQKENTLNSDIVDEILTDRILKT